MKLKTTSILCTLGILSALGAACNSSSSSSVDKYLNQGKALARVGDEKINEGYLALLQKVNPGIKSQIDSPQGKKRIVDNLIEQEMLYQESVSRGLEKQSSVQEKVDLYKRVIVAQALLETELDKKALAYYTENKEKEFERVKVSHIFFAFQPSEALTPGKTPPAPPSEEEKKKLESEAEAKANKAYERLKAGESWDAVVKDSTEDKVSAERGGDFGYITRADKRIERLEYQGLVESAFKMKKDEYSAPIKAKDGWHILKTTEAKEIQSFEDASTGIKFKMRGDVKGIVMADLKKKMKVEYLDTSLVEAAPAPAAAPIPPAPVDKVVPPPAAKAELKEEKK